jgi:hypothetical protein
MEEAEERSAPLIAYHFTILLHLISPPEERIVNRQGKVESPPQKTTIISLLAMLLLLYQQ